MTTIVIKIDSFNMDDSDLSDVTNYLSMLLTPTEARYFDDASNYQSFTGTGLTYDLAGDFTGGTVTGATTVEGGLQRISMTGFSMSAADLQGTFDANDIDGLWDLMLAGNDVIRGSDFGDFLLANAGNDRIFGNGGDDILKGQTGNDRLEGGDGLDMLIGGVGSDRLDGGLKADTLNGGSGTDSFVFSTALGAGNIDTIQDFSVVNDSILLADAIFNRAGIVGPLAASRFYVGTAAHDTSDRIIYNAVSGALSYDDDGDGAHAAVQFAVLRPGLALTAADFSII
jgi:Ca2+-binding RTX toxin-like protein